MMIIIKLLILLCCLQNIYSNIINNINSDILSSLLFYETFDNNNDIFTSGKWIKSNNDKFKDQPILVRPAKQPAPGTTNCYYYHYYYIYYQHHIYHYHH